ncbi:hypothetical protein AB0K16_53520 [Nonomuraea jabiensis]|uniref:hypothetical protein n=1 Tax=Nonomuraea jabiensis TaxID=882448 RepID=UPI003429B242
MAYTLVLWHPIALLPDAVDAAFQLALWAAIDPSPESTRARRREMASSARP